MTMEENEFFKSNNPFGIEDKFTVEKACKIQNEVINAIARIFDDNTQEDGMGILETILPVSCGCAHFLAVYAETHEPRLNVGMVLEVAKVAIDALDMDEIRNMVEQRKKES